MHTKLANLQDRGRMQNSTILHFTMIFVYLGTLGNIQKVRNAGKG